MGWAAVREKGVTTIEGDIGDPLLIHVVARFDRAIDFRGHTWLAQIRRNDVDGPLFATFTLTEDATVFTPAAGDDPGSGVIDLLFTLADTSVSQSDPPEPMEPETPYVYGVKATVGANAPYTLIRSKPLTGHRVVPRVET